MGANLLVGGIALSTAFASAVAAAFVAEAVLRRRRTAVVAQGGEPGFAGFVGWRLRNGYGFALPPARWLLGRNRIRSLVDSAVMACSNRGFRTTDEALASVVLVGSAALWALAGLALGNLLAGLACVACLIAIGAAIAANVHDRREEAIRDAVPDALDTMGACFSSGFTLQQTFAEVARSVSGPLGATFARSAHILETGGGAGEALGALRQGAHASELAFVAVALDVQHQSGGTMRQVIGAATDTVKGNLALRRSLRVQTAQARLSARIVSLMPLVLVAAFSLASPDFLMPFFSGPLGYALLGLAVIMQLSGIALVRRALSVDGVI